jgi:hypothetical protein
MCHIVQGWQEEDATKDHTVYDGKAIGVLLGLHMLEGEEEPGEVVFSIDNQAVIKATDANRPHPRQDLIDRILKATEELEENNDNNYKLTLHWIPGHSEVKGNKEVDKGAKKAAEGKISSAWRLPGFLMNRALPASVAAVGQAHTEKLIKDWKQRWSKLRRFQCLMNIDLDLPSKKSTGRLTALSKGLMSLVIQLHTSHVPLNAYLFRINKSDTDKCPSCQ